MRKMELPSQSWSADDAADQKDNTTDDSSQTRSLHYGG
jgi:hypothetical protein